MNSVAPAAPEPDQSAKFRLIGRDFWILLALWLLVALVDRTWIYLDQAPPHWDQGDHLSRALNHWRVLQHPAWFSAEWWRTLWQQAPTQRAPLVYLLTAPFFLLFGVSVDSAMMVNLLLAAVLMVSTYLMGRRLFDRTIGLWAAGLVCLSPLLAQQRLDYLLDYGLTATTAFAAAGLTYWWTAKEPRSQWGFTLVWGVGVASMLLTRTSGLLFVVALLGWAGLLSLATRQGPRLLQLLIGLVLGVALIWPWFSTSWLTIISTTFESTAHGVSYVGSPQANTLAGWLYYPQQLPAMVSSPILFLGLAAGLLAMAGVVAPGGWRAQPLPQPHSPPRQAWLWLGGLILVILVLGALGANKQPRLLAPIIPLLAVALARLLWWRRHRPWHWLRWLAVVASALLLFWATFPLPGSALSRYGWYPYQGAPWPHAEIVAAITRQAPHLESNLGMATNTAELHTFGMGFYGGAANFQVTSRQLGLRPETATADAQALDWYLTKTGDQGAYDTIESGQARLKEAILASPDLAVAATWPLPDGSEARLHHRRQPRVEVQPLGQTAEQVTLTAVEVPNQLVAGQITPITYRLAGPWDELQQGLLLLSWQPGSDNAPPRWISDHAIGLGQLYGEGASQVSQSFSVTERLGVVPPNDLPPGVFRLTATYVNRTTGDHYPMVVPSVEVDLLPAAPDALADTAATAPPLDLVTVLRQLSRGLATGAIDPIFSEVGRINQYDARQDYLVQAEQALGVRLQTHPDNLDWLYGKALAQVLQQNAPAAIATLNHITQVAPDNPYHWTYLGFVHLYSWQPRRAEAALNQAAALQPDLPDLKLLQAAAALMQFKLSQGVALLREAEVL